MKSKCPVLFAVVCLLLTEGFLCAETKTPSKGSPFPHVALTDQLSREARSYLGLPGKKGVSLENIRGKLIVVEIFNTYCTTCPKDVPVLNSVYSAVEDDPGLRGIVRVVAVAVGNNRKEVESFRKEHGVRYPIIADPNFALHKALGNPRVPYTFLLGKRARMNVILDVHQGALDSAESLLMRIRDSL